VRGALVLRVRAGEVARAFFDVAEQVVELGVLVAAIIDAICARASANLPSSRKARARSWPQA
jgi:hypothetical protein